MGRASKEKGKRGEREVVRILQPIVDQVYGEFGVRVPLLERNLQQSHRGGFDIAGLEWMALEVKYREEFAVDAWWEQTLAQCGQHQTPILFYRRNKVEWKVRLYGMLQANGVFLHTPVTVDLAIFRQWFRLRLIQELSHV